MKEQVKEQVKEQPNDPYEIWERECELASRVRMDAPPAIWPDVTIEAAERLLAVARYLAGVDCSACGGIGERVYGSTATWAGGIGGQALTSGVCDECWGSGRSDRKGPNRRKIHAIEQANRRAVKILTDLTEGPT